MGYSGRACPPASKFSRKQLARVSAELTDRVEIGAEQREVRIDGLDRPKLGIGNEPPLGLAVPVAT